jgi:hypothetical protein
MDPTEKWDVVWTGSFTKGLTNSRIFKPSLKKRDYPTRRVRLDFKISSNFYQVDAVRRRRNFNFLGKFFLF